jgi:3-dehydroquinate dehydratase
MTWDILHIRNIQTEMANRNTNSKLNMFFVHSFASHDKGLIDIIKSNPINRLILYKNEAYPRYEEGFEDICKDLNTNLSFLKNTFNREEYRKNNQNSYLRKLACQLESAIHNLN